MADVSEDLLACTVKPNPPPNPSNAYPSPTLTPTAGSDADPDEEGEQLLDFGLLLKLGGSKWSKKPPSRGLKDFEEDGTKLQSSVLRASRAAMHEVLSQERVHGMNAERAVWDGIEGGGAWVTKEGGSWVRTVGRSRRVQNTVEETEDRGADGEELGKKAKKWISRMWLLPEEVLWLVERGSLDIRWPAMPGEPDDEGLPMSLQAAYSVFLGGQEEWELTLEKYTVYQYLKRAGYVVIRADENWVSIPKTSPSRQPEPSFAKSVWDLLWTSFFTETQEVKWKRQSRGPLVTPGLYSDYNSIYRLLTLVPYHDPQSTPSVLPLPQISQDQDPRITYHIYKPSSLYKKSQPGPPDFYIAVINSRKSSVPTEAQIEAMLCQTPFHPPMKEDPNVYRKLKTGYRNVILAVVDQGIVNFVNVVDAAFGQAKLWERSPMKRSGGSSSKGRGGRGRGRGR